MTSMEVLATVLARIADSTDGVVYITEEELARWPTTAVKILKANNLLIEAAPARSATCDGCERRCSMKVEIIDYPSAKGAFIFCDKRDDIPRVEVPFERLRRWQASGFTVAAMVARMLGATPLSGALAEAKRWPVGRLRGRRATERLDLDGKSVLNLEVAGHSVELAEIMSLTGKKLILDSQALIDCVDNPAVRRGRAETVAERRARIANLAREKGVPAAAAAEGISESRIKQITAAHRQRSAAK
jgi:hypothetical protein